MSMVPHSGSVCYTRDMADPVVANAEADEEREAREEERRRYIARAISQQAIINTARAINTTAQRMVTQATSADPHIMVTATLVQSQAILNLAKSAQLVFTERSTSSRRPTRVTFELLDASAPQLPPAAPTPPPEEPPPAEAPASPDTGGEAPEVPTAAPMPEPPTEAAERGDPVNSDDDPASDPATLPRPSELLPVLHPSPVPAVTAPVARQPDAVLSPGEDDDAPPVYRSPLDADGLPTDPEELEQEIARLERIASKE